MSALPVYRHEPLLSRDNIRILELQPAEDHDAPLRCELVQQSLGEAKDAYEAISYTWGQPVFPVPLHCTDHTTHLITENLGAALREFRRSDSVRRVWADAVCINQADDVEKSHQVTRMGRIYSHASATLAWLGESDAHTASLAMAKCRELAAEWKAYGLSQPTPVCVDDMHDQPKQAKRASLAEHTDANVALWALLSEPWFRRLWCVQEVVLSRQATLFWGSQSIPWDVFTTALCVVRNVALEKLKLEDEPCWLDANSDVDSGGFTCWEPALMTVTTHYYRLGGAGGRSTSFNLLELCKLFRHFRCKDPRDRVYALLGICGDLPQLQADYTQTYSQMLARLARSHFTANHLGFLHYVRNPHDPDDLAESLPWWATLLTNSPLTAMPFGGKADLLFRAGAHERAHISCSSSREDPAVTIDGYLCDSVVAVAPVSRNLSQPAAVVIPALLADAAQAIAPLMRANPTYRTGAPWLAALTRVFLADCRYRDTHVWRDMPDVFFHMLGERILARAAAGGGGGSGATGSNPLLAAGSLLPSPPASPPSGSLATVENGIVHLFCSWAAQVASRRDFVVTMRGFVGFAPMGVEPGDAVCVFAGGETPFVLRGLGRRETFRVVGDAYVHGLMDGEVAKLPGLSKTAVQLA